MMGKVTYYLTTCWYLQLRSVFFKLKLQLYEIRKVHKSLDSQAPKKIFFRAETTKLTGTLFTKLLLYCLKKYCNRMFALPYLLIEVHQG